MENKEKNGLIHHAIVVVAGLALGRFVAQSIFATNDRAIIVLAAVLGALGLWMVRETLSIMARQISGRGVDVCRSDSWIYLTFLSVLAFPQLSGISELFVKGEFARIYLGINIVAVLYLWVSCMVWRLAGVKWSALSKTMFFAAILTTYIKLHPETVFDMLTLEFAVASLLGWAILDSLLLVIYSLKRSKLLALTGLSVIVISAIAWTCLTASPKIEELPGGFTLSKYPKALKLNGFSSSQKGVFAIRVSVADDLRDADVFYYPGSIKKSHVIEPKTMLNFGISIPFYNEAESSEGTDFSLTLSGIESPIWTDHLDPVKNPDDRGWKDISVDLTPYAGATVEMTFSVKGAPYGTISSPRIAKSAINKVNYIVILVDTLRADKIDEKIAPNIYALAENGMVFNNAISPAPWTEPATASLLTGMSPDQLGVAFPMVSFEADAPTIADKMLANGYYTIGFSGSPLISRALKFDKGFSRFDETCAPHFHWRSAECMTDNIIGFLANNKGPFFMYAHYVDPHSRYDAPPPYGDRYSYGYTGSDENVRIGEIVPFVIRAKRGQKVIVSDYDAKYLEARYLAEIAYVDAEIGRLVKYLKDNGLFDNTVIVLTADHGEEFMEHGIVGHIFNLHQNLLHVPMIFAGGGIKGGTKIDEAFSLADVVPTLLDMAHIPAYKGLWGESFLRPRYSATVPPSRIVISSRADMWNEGYSAYDGRYRLIIDGKGRRELYDHQSDPGEYVNLAGRSIQTEETLANAISSYRSWVNQNKIKPSSRGDIAEQKKRLKALGYIGE